MLLQFLVIVGQAVVRACFSIVMVVADLVQRANDLNSQLYTIALPFYAFAYAYPCYILAQYREPSGSIYLRGAVSPQTIQDFLLWRGHDIITKSFYRRD